MLDASHANNQTAATLTNNIEPQFNTSNGESFVKEPSTIPGNVSREEDKDQIESSETIVYNRFQNPSESKLSEDNFEEESSPEEKYSSSSSEEEEEEPEGPPDHVIPHSEHEEPRNVPTKPKYTAPGEWARPPKDKEVHLEFVPTKMYAQVRKTHTLRKLPRKKAIENAESEEERRNAARLRAVVKNTKVNTVYTEEGYEDSAYDHAGQVRDADFHEGYARKLHDHLDLKKKAGDDDRDDQEEENETKNEKYRRIEPEEFEEFDEDNGDETDTASKISDNVPVNPKLVAEKGIEKLQDDLEREAEEMEKGIEISKLEKVQTTTDREILAESRKRDNYDEKMDRRRKTKRRKSSSLGNIENTTAISMDENVISTDRGIETTTAKENLDNFDDSQDPTTVSYSQLFWDYFKTRQDPLTATESQLTLESTTLNQALVQSYSVHEETTTSFPTIEPVILRSQEATSDRISMNSEYSKDSGRSSELLPLDSTGLEELWRSINSNEQLKTEVSPFSETYNNQGVPLLSPQNNNEAFVNQNFGTSLFGPTLNSANGRKLRYKITVRHKPKEPEKPSNPEIQSSDRESSTSNVISRPNKIETASRKPLLLNENYMKVLMHVKNEKNSKNPQHHHPNSLHRYNLQRNNHFSSGSNKNDLEDLTRMRPPLPQKEPDYYYNNFVALSKPEIDLTAHSSRVSFPVSQNYRRAYTNPRTYQVYLDLPQTWQLPINRQKNAKLSFDLPPPRNDLTRQKEPIDYVNGGGNRWKQGRNVSRSFGQTANRDGVRGIRAKRRERRFVGADGDESDVAKGSVVKNGASNRGEIEWAAKNLSSAGRNCRQKVTRLLRVGLGLDTSRAKQFRQKKSRYRGNDHVGEGSRAVERESIATSGNEGRNEDIKSDLRAFKHDDGKKQEGSVTNLEERERDVEENDFNARNELKVPAKLLNETSGVFGRKKRELSIINLVNEHENLSNETFKMTEQKKENGNSIDLIAKNNTSKKIEGMNEKGNVTDTVKEEEIYSEMEEELKERKLDEKEDAEEKDSEVRNELKVREILFDRTEKKEEGYIMNTIRKKKDVRKEDSKLNEELKKHAELLNEAPKIAEDVINEEINARFNKDGQTDKEKGNEEKEDDNEEPVEVEIPEFDYVEEQTEEDQAEDIVTTEATIDPEKYPFYNDEKMPTPSALKYAIDPKRLPAKTYGAMEFYNSRDAYKQCDEIEPNLKVLPEKEEPVADKGPETNVPRLKGLGDKLDCYKAKYFDENPFDNPLFLEKQVEDPVAPAEIDSKQFASRIMMFPKEDDDYVIQKSSRRPENYRQPRKQASTPVVFQKRRPIRYKTFARTPQQMRIRKRPQSYRVPNSRIKYVKNPRRPLKIEKRPVASASEISSMKLLDSTPYQSQVYEDVMGTIKNLANSYQVYETTTTPASEGITTIDVTINDVKTNSSTNSTSSKKKEKSNVSKDVVDRPNNVKVGINTKGSVPNNKYQNRYRMYKRPRVPQNGRLRVQPMQKPVVGIRTVKRRRKIRIYKRDLSDGLNDEKLSVGSIELDLQSDERRMEKEDETGSKFSNSNKENYQPTKKEMINAEYSTIEGGKNLPAQENPMNARKRSKVPKSVAIDNSNGDKDQKEKKVVYTIKDRIRYSRPKDDVWKVGKFSNKTEAEEDKRRKEPKYNYIKRKSSSNPVLITAEQSSSPSLTNRINWTESATTTEKVIELGSEEVGKENREIEYKIGETEGNRLNGSENVNDTKQDLIGRSDEEIVNKTEAGYAVYENVNEGEATTTQKPQLSTSSAFLDLKTFLEDDPPKYPELSNEDFEKLFSPNDNSNVTLNSTNSNESLEKKESKTGKENDEDASKTFRQSYFSDENSSEGTETKEKENARSSTESSEESSVASKESESDEHRPFFSYSSRPSSPAENYEDERYSELGPRVNKPAFHHPPFFNYKTSRESSEEMQESNEEKEEHVFPWYKDKEDERKRRRRRYRGRADGRYEYPWERRERLEREERRRREEKQKGREDWAKSFDDDEEEAEEASAAKYRRNIYPRGRHRFWGRLDSDSLEDSTSDNVESSSENRPITRYSSRYNSRKVKLPVGKKSGSVEEIGKSIKKPLEDSSKGKGTLEGKETSSGKKKPAASHKSRYASRGTIVSENVTSGPITNLSNRETSMDNSSISSILPRNRNSSDLMKNTLNNTRMTVVEGPREFENSTKQEKTNKRKRRPLKNAVSTKLVIGANRARQRQKPSSTTPAAVQPTFSVATTTSAPRFVRRRNQKAKDSRRKNYVPNVVLDNSGDGTNSTSETGTVGESSRGRKGDRTNEIADVPTKSHRDQELSLKSSMKQKNLTVNSGPENETVEERFIDDDVRQSKEAEEVKGTFLPVGSDEKFDFKDDRIETLSDFDKTDDDYEIESVLKTDGDFTPQNRALQLREQSSREIISSVSWVSENYDF